MTKLTSKYKVEQLQTHNSHFFVVVLGEAPMGYKDAVLPEPLTKNHTGDCRTYEENTRKPYKDNLPLFRALAFQLHGNGGLVDETSKMFTLFLEKIVPTTPATFQGKFLNEILIAEDLVQVNIFLYDLDFFDGVMIGELARRNVGKHFNSVGLLR